MNNDVSSQSNSQAILPSFSWKTFFKVSAAVFVIPFFCLIFIIENPLQLILDYGQFFFLGLGGAIIANSTGAGGGIVFIPAFTSMGVVGISALGTSLAIQCFGMTAGSLSWLHAMHNKNYGGQQTIQLTYKLLLLAGVTSTLGMLCAQYLLVVPSWPIETIFKYFSILFGAVLLFAIVKRKDIVRVDYLRRRDMPLIAIICFLGGIITSWISIGAGEWLAILLFFLGYPTMVVVCVAVCISSMVVLVGIPYHIWIVDSISWQILLFAAPAAIVGGTVARLLSERLGPVRLKIFFSIWVLATGILM
ncbi:MAG: sulfite exporter TauE/SafE family protein [Pseudomonadales bacterium]|nr:sulfite exporter TauE/SafE family protein [Pseudomonadales bacterium]